VDGRSSLVQGTDGAAPSGSFFPVNVPDM
jgi:hypothetical protein